jgi:hypothetical protein
MMAIKLNSLSRWNRLGGGKKLVLSGRSTGGERRVRLSVNVEESAKLYVLTDDGEERLLAVVAPGLETVEFTAPGELQIYTDAREDAEVWFTRQNRSRPLSRSWIR